MNLIQGVVAFLGRFFLSLIFISSGINQIMNWQETELEMTNAFHDCLNLTMGVDFVQNILLFGVSSISFLLVSAIFLQIVGGLSVLLGIKVRLGAFLLIVFLAPATLLFHHFWLLQGPDRQQQMIELMKNVSILGGLFVLLAYGKGKKSCQHDPNDPAES